MERIKTYKEFWPFYLNEHKHPLNRKLHFVGTTLVFGVLILSIRMQNWQLLWGMPLVGYFFAWCGHFLVEKNRPATFRYPLWSLFSDFKMFFLMVLGRIR